MSSVRPALSVSLSGLHQLAARAQALSGQLSTDVASPLAASTWQANTVVVNIGCAASRKDLAAMTARMNAFAAHFAVAVAAYADNEDTSAAELARLVP